MRPSVLKADRRDVHVEALGQLLPEYVHVRNLVLCILHESKDLFVPRRLLHLPFSLDQRTKNIFTFQIFPSHFFIIQVTFSSSGVLDLDRRHSLTNRRKIAPQFILHEYSILPQASNRFSAAAAELLLWVSFHLQRMKSAVFWQF